jgi:hypothetical protein
MVDAVEIKRGVNEADGELLIGQIGAARAAVRQFVLELEGDAVLSATEFGRGERHQRYPSGVTDQAISSSVR